MASKLTNSWGQEIDKDWTRKLTVESIFDHLGSMEHLEVSRGMAAKITGLRVPRCGYEVTVREQDVHGNRGHVKRLYLANVSNAKYYFWLYESPCITCHHFAR